MSQACLSRKTVLATGTRSANRRVQDSPCTAKHLGVETTCFVPQEAFTVEPAKILRLLLEIVMSLAGAGLQLFFDFGKGCSL